MIASTLLACGTTTEWTTSELLFFPGGPNTVESTDGPVTEAFEITADAVDVLLAVDPALLDSVAAAVPVLVEQLRDSGSDARLGIVSTALGDPNTAGDLVRLDGSDGWWTPAVPFVAPVGPVPTTPPLGAMGATFLALERPRYGAAVRLLLAQEADDATPGIMAPEFVDWLDGLGDVELVVLAPERAPVLDSVAGLFDGERFVAGADMDDVLGAVSSSLPWIRRTFPLAGRPAVSSVQVRVEVPAGVELSFEADEWTYDPVTNSVTFVEYLPSPLSTVLVTYDGLE